MYCKVHFRAHWSIINSMKSNISRRDFFNVIKYFGVATLTTAAVSYYAGEFEPAWLEVTNVEVPLVRLPEAFRGFRVAHISDIHIGGWMNRSRLAHVVDVVDRQKPDLVVITGDFVIGHSWSGALDDAAEDFVEVMSSLTSTYPVLAVLGNHDHWTDSVRTRAMLARAGVQELRNDFHRLERNGEYLYIAGLDDVTEGKQEREVLESRLPAKADAILLVHEPDYVERSSRNGRFLLQLSGHSHGGQVVLPFIGPPVLPRWGRKYPSGLYQVGSMWLYTSRGVGMTSPFVRFNCRPEVAVLTLNGPE